MASIKFLEDMPGIVCDNGTGFVKVSSRSERGPSVLCPTARCCCCRLLLNNTISLVFGKTLRRRWHRIGLVDGAVRYFVPGPSRRSHGKRRCDGTTEYITRSGSFQRHHRHRTSLLHAFPAPISAPRSRSLFRQQTLPTLAYLLSLPWAVPPKIQRSGMPEKTSRAPSSHRSWEGLFCALKRPSRREWNSKTSCAETQQPPSAPR